MSPPDLTVQSTVQTETGYAPRIVIWVADVLDRVAVTFCGVLLSALVGVMFVGVIFRYVLDNALPWSDSLALVITVWLVFIGAAVALRRNYHPAITIVTHRLHGEAATAAALARDILIGAYLLVVAAAGWAGVSAPAQPHLAELPLSYAVPFAAIPVGALLMLIQWLRMSVRIQPTWAVILTLAGAILVGVLLNTIIETPPYWLTVVPFPLVALVLPILFALGIPIALVLGLFSLSLLAFQGGVPSSIVLQQLYAGVENPAFLAIPAFMLTGTLMEVTKLSESLVSFASGIVGRVRGGLAVADVLASALFADTSGSAVADTAAIGAVMLPGMQRRGYDKPFTAAHQAASGSLGTLFPPSISMIIFATVASVSVTQLFLSSIVPGVLVAASYALVAYVIARRRGYPKEPAPTVTQFLGITVSAVPALLAPAVILGGILLGVFAPYEAGAVAACYVFAVSLVRYLRGHHSEYGRALLQATQTTTMVMFIIANATILAWSILRLGLPQAAVSLIAAVSSNEIIVLLLVSLFLIVLGIFLEPPAILIAVVPILLPVVQAVGTDPIRFGVIVMLSSAIGMLLPPIGVSLLVAVGIAQTSIERAARAAVPYVLVGAVNLVLVVVFPQLTSWLTHLR